MANQKALHRQICSKYQGRRKIPFGAMDHVIINGNTIIWTLRANEAPEHIREARIGIPTTTREAHQQEVRERWRFESGC